MTESELEGWREAHKHLTHAILVAKEAVVVAKSQRRFWMEEIAANLTPEGKLTTTSVWKKPTKPTRRTPAKRKVPEKPIKRRRKSDETMTEDESPISNPKKTVKKKKAAEDGGPKNKKKIRLNLKAPGSSAKAKKTKPAKKEEPIVEVYAQEGGDYEDQSDFHAMHAEQQALPHHSFPVAYGGPGKVLPVDPYRMIHQRPMPGMHMPGFLPTLHGPPAAMPAAFPNAYASVLPDSDETTSTSSSQDS